jgi:DNA-binding transcriptional regulator YdaS (Cro superfamily)
MKEKSLRQLARELGVSASYLSQVKNGKRPPSQKVAAVLDSTNIMESVKQSVKQLTVDKTWRERMGVEPTMDAAGHPSTDLKSAELTGAHSLPPQRGHLST